MYRIVLIILFFSPSIAAAQLSESTIDEYLIASLEEALDQREENLEAWKAHYVDLEEGGNIVAELIGYQPPNFLVNAADVSSHLYERTGDDRYAEITRDLLVAVPDQRRFFPDAFRTRIEYEDGVPAVNWFRSLPVYAEAWIRTRDSGVYSSEDIAAVEEAVASSVNIVFAFPEWGAMNRAMLRAESFMAAYRAFPEAERASDWLKMARILADDSIRNWEIEDASIYHAVWMRSYMNYLDLADQPEVFHSPMFKYYFDYIVALLTPDGTVPEFGDGRWDTSVDEYYAALERGAKEYQSPEMRWAALRMLQRMGGVVEQNGTYQAGSAFDESRIGFARTLIDYRKYADPDLAPQKPDRMTDDVLEGVIGKKIVFRSGWDPQSTYLLLNYKDEGYEELMQKEYLKHVLAVEEEKMHHGHSDENGISLLMKDGAILLYDAGYRPYAPSGPFGAWRADYFHNRIVVRDVRKAANQDFFDVLRHAGAYNPAVRTSRLDLATFPPVEYSRTRLDDPHTGYRWDRMIVRDKQEDFFVVVDAVRFERADYFTVTNLWHTREILDSVDNWVVTRYDSLAGVDPNPGDLDLLLIFPQSERYTGLEPISRSHQQEVAIYQGVSQFYPRGRMLAFVTILYPLDEDRDPGAVAERFQLIKDDERGIGLSFERDGQTEWMGFKLDTDADLLTEDIRPRYTYESSRVSYGPIDTDADFFHVKTAADGARFSATHFVRLDFQGETLFDAPSSQFFQTYGRSDVVGRAKWRRWHNYQP